MYSLGLLLSKHPELASSPAESRTLLDTASNAGSWKASVVLGILMRDGNGVPQDSAAAYFHFRVAILQGGESARLLLANDLTKLNRLLSQERARTLDLDAADWFEHHNFCYAFVTKDGEPLKQFPILKRTANDEGTHAGQLTRLPPT
jgi:TPR repeat protein